MPPIVSEPAVVAPMPMIANAIGPAVPIAEATRIAAGPVVQASELIAPIGVDVREAIIVDVRPRGAIVDKVVARAIADARALDPSAAGTRTIGEAGVANTRSIVDTWPIVDAGPVVDAWPVIDARTISDARVANTRSVVDTRPLDSSASGTRSIPEPWLQRLIHAEEVAQVARRRSAAAGKTWSATARLVGTISSQPATSRLIRQIDSGAVSRAAKVRTVSSSQSAARIKAGSAAGAGKAPAAKIGNAGPIAAELRLGKIRSARPWRDVRPIGNAGIHARQIVRS